MVGPSPSSALAAACERALCRAARTRAAHTRQQVRAAARAFVRRHRRDSGYLRWVLRSVRASSALAVALLGLTAAPSGAEIAPFTAQVSNPLSGESPVHGATPTLGDLDGDGDLDMFTGFTAGGLIYFQNTGSASNPAFLRFITTGNPIPSQDVGSNSAPLLGDLDGDGDLDVVVGEYDGVFNYYKNTGTATSPAFVQQLGAGNPLNGLDAGTLSTPSLGDLDGDGDLDLVTGGGAFNYYENTGSPLSPAFVALTGAANPLDGLVAVVVAPVLGDLDFDGDLDLISGQTNGTFVTLENTGDPTSPAFALVAGAANPLTGLDLGDHTRSALGDLDGDGLSDLIASPQAGTYHRFESRVDRFFARLGSTNPFAGHDVGSYSKTALGDLDADGDSDVVAGEQNGAFFYFENTGGPTNPVLVARTGTANPLAGENVGLHSAPALGDLDGDGDLDLVAGELDGVFSYFQNTGTAAAPAFAVRTGSANPLDGRDVGYHSMPGLGDLDDDGDLDLFAGDVYGMLAFFQNQGGAASPVFVLQTGSANPLVGQDVGNHSTIAFSDLDRDGDPDLVIGEATGAFHYFENTGLAAAPALIARTGADDPFATESQGPRSTPSLADLDGDGDIDLVSGHGNGGIGFLENFVLPDQTFFAVTGTADPLDGEDIGLLSNSALGDLDRDGDLDLVVGDYNGQLWYLANTGSSIDPAFLRIIGAANPFNFQDSGLHGTPELGDLDGDGDLDVVVGDFYGGFAYYRNTGNPSSPAFVAVTGASNPFAGLDAGDRSAPALGDVDADGDLDLVAGAQTNAFLYWENAGIATNPAFVAVTGGANPLAGLNAGFHSTPVLGDVDRDGDLDLLAGEFYGAFAYFENHGTAENPNFVPATGAANPLDGEDVGGKSSPAFGDLDGDGDLDLVTGDSAGTFSVHYLPEPARGLLLGAGIALLKGLERVRGRRKG